MNAQARGVLIAIAFLLALPAGAAAQEMVTISVPASISFGVTNVAVDTVANPSQARVSFSGLVVLPLRVLRVSVRADAAAFTPPSPSTGIPSANVRWTTSNASGGTGSNGALSSAAWTQIFQSSALVTSGHVDLTFTLGAPGGGIRAGNHTLTIRYKFESM
jgi:hypothetical protein